MMAFLDKFWKDLPGWAKGAIAILVVGAWVWTQVQAHRADKDRALLWDYGKALHVAHETHREIELPEGWTTKK